MINIFEAKWYKIELEYGICCWITDTIVKSFVPVEYNEIVNFKDNTENVGTYIIRPISSNHNHYIIDRLIGKKGIKKMLESNKEYLYADMLNEDEILSIWYNGLHPDYDRVVTYNASLCHWKTLIINNIKGYYCNKMVNEFTVPDGFNIHYVYYNTLNHCDEIDSNKQIYIDINGVFITTTKDIDIESGRILHWNLGDSLSTFQNIMREAGVEWKFNKRYGIKEDTISENNVSLEGEIPEPASVTTTSTIVINRPSPEDFTEGVESATFAEPSYGAICMICKESYDVDMYSTPKLICPTCIGKLRKLMNIEVDEE